MHELTEFRNLNEFRHTAMIHRTKLSLLIFELPRPKYKKMIIGKIKTHLGCNKIKYVGASQ